MFSEKAWGWWVPPYQGGEEDGDADNPPVSHVLIQRPAPAQGDTESSTIMSCQGVQGDTKSVPAPARWVRNPQQSPSHSPDEPKPQPGAEHPSGTSPSLPTHSTFSFRYLAAIQGTTNTTGVPASHTANPVKPSTRLS